LASAKIAASESARHIRAALACLAEETAEHKHLFPDYLTFIGKPVEDIRALVRGRIAEHKAREAEKLEAERERIRREEAEKLAREQAEAELKKAQASPEGADLSPAAQELNEQQGAQRFAEHHPTVSPPAPKAGARIKLGDINARIAPLSITADGLASLGFQPVGTERAAKLYAEADMPAICAALTKVLERAQFASSRKAA